MFIICHRNWTMLLLNLGEQLCNQCISVLLGQSKVVFPSASPSVTVAPASTNLFTNSPEGFFEIAEKYKDICFFFFSFA